MSIPGDDEELVEENTTPQSAAERKRQITAACLIVTLGFGCIVEVSVQAIAQVLTPKRVSQRPFLDCSILLGIARFASLCNSAVFT